jgi:hypothetical protein
MWSNGKRSWQPSNRPLVRRARVNSTFNHLVPRRGHARARETSCRPRHSGPAWRVHGTSDFNCDGKVDTGEHPTAPAVWLMEGFNVVAGSNVGFDRGARHIDRGQRVSSQPLTFHSPNR